MKYNIKTSWLFNRLTRNVVFWIAFTFYHYSSKNHEPALYFVLLFTLLISYGIPCYIHNLVLIPRFLVKRKYRTYGLLFLLLLAITTIVSYYITHFVNDTFEGLNYMGNLKDVAIPYHVFPSMLMFCLLTFGKFTADAINNQRTMEQLETDRLQSELESLKSQVNPHFLFNALNTIYGMARRTDWETADAVIKLSDILRYVLYDCDVDKISVEKELSFVEQYIAFNKLRLHNQENIKLEIKAAHKHQNIAPLILIPFVENAIKHGLGKHSQNSWVDIKIDTSEHGLYFRCANSNHNKDIETEYEVGGIGMRNVKRRLDLLYPSQYHLEITDKAEAYITELNLELK